MLPTIVRYRLRQTYNTFTRSPRQKKLGWLISIAFIIPYYSMLTNAMRTIYRGVYINSGWQSLARLVSGNLSMIFFFVLISTAALTLYRMFQAKDLRLLVSLPIQDSSLFWSKLTESLMDAGRSMILPLPFCLAFASLIGPFSAVVFFVGWVIVMFQLGSLSIIIALALGKLIIASRWGLLLRIIAVMAALAFLVIAIGYVQQTDDVTSVMDMPSAAPVSRFVSLSFLFPSSWLLALLPHSFSISWLTIIYGLGFIAVTVCFPIAAFHLFVRRFRRLWMMTMEVKQRGHSQKRAERDTSTSKDAMGITRTLMLKEVRVVRREPHIWIGLIVPLILLPVFIFLKANNHGTQAVYIIVVSLLTTASYSLSSIGREGRNFNILRSLPMRMSALLRAKLLLGFAINLAVTLAFVMALYLSQRSSLNQTRYNVLTALITSIYLPAFGTALSALFPKFDFTNPTKAVSLPGLLMLYLIAFLFGLTLVGIVTAGWHLVPLVLFPWAGVAFALMKAGQDRLERMDI